jgi:cytochrome c oxidase assembly protein subunit 11
MAEKRPVTSLQRQHRIVALTAVCASVVMLGLSFAAVPLYRAFCSLTGFAGTPQIAEKAPATRGQRTMSVSFDTNVGDLPWKFEPELRSVRVQTGETKTVFFKVTNLSQRETAGVAAYNISPDQAGGWFNKISCFCFDVTHLGPGQTAELPVVFFLDPALEKDETMAQVDSVTLSYTFFADKKEKKPVAAAETKEGAKL